MQIATFNVNSLRARIGIVRDWIKDNKPDVLCLQETKVQDDEFPEDEFDGFEYNFVYRGQKTYNGVAIISRHEINDVEMSLDEDPKDEARLIKAAVNNVAIINAYVPQGQSRDSDMFQYKLEWLGNLKKFIDKRFKKKDKVVLVGDLNIAPEDRDVYDPEILEGHVCFNEEVSKIFDDLKDWGFVDCFRKHNEKHSQFSFWDYREGNAFKKNRGWRLDHILATKPMADKCSKCYIDKGQRELKKPSDHTPVIAEFDI